MANLIQKLSLHQIDPERKYFLDANIWILILKSPLNPRSRETQYLKFFESLLEKKISIYAHSLLLSEIFNRIMRINFDEYKSDLKQDPQNRLSQKEIDNLFFKKDLLLKIQSNDLMIEQFGNG